VAGVIAWEPLPPLRAHLAPLAPDCKPGQLMAALAWQGRRQQQANQTETLAATVHVTNVSAAACLCPHARRFAFSTSAGSRWTPHRSTGRSSQTTSPSPRQVAAPAPAARPATSARWVCSADPGVGQLVPAGPGGGLGPAAIRRRHPRARHHAADPRRNAALLRPRPTDHLGQHGAATGRPTDGTPVGGPDTLNIRLGVPKARTGRRRPALPGLLPAAARRLGRRAARWDIGRVGVEGLRLGGPP
jgi:hypothetical protein